MKPDYAANPQSHPFYKGSHFGMPFFCMNVDDRLSLVKTFNEQQCLAALELPGLQKVVGNAIVRRLSKIAREGKANG